MIQRRWVDHLKARLKALVPSRFEAYGDLWYAQLTSPLYRGEAVECLLCDGQFSKFLPWYSGSRPARCPRCRSMPRHRLLKLYLERQTDLFSRPHRLLHVAPEYALQRSLRRASNIKFLSADLDSPFAMEHFDLTRAPHPDGAFTAILCNHVLEHIPDDRAAIREIHRLLEPGGWALLMVPTVKSGPTQEDPTLSDPAERERRFGQADHFRLYGNDYGDRLREAGFEVEFDKFGMTLTEQEAERYGIVRNEVIPVVRKR